MMTSIVMMTSRCRYDVWSWWRRSVMNEMTQNVFTIMMSCHNDIISPFHDVITDLKIERRRPDQWARPRYRVRRFLRRYRQNLSRSPGKISHVMTCQKWQATDVYRHWVRQWRRLLWPLTTSPSISKNKTAAIQFYTFFSQYKSKEIWISNSIFINVKLSRIKNVYGKIENLHLSKLAFMYSLCKNLTKNDVIIFDLSSCTKVAILALYSLAFPCGLSSLRCVRSSTQWHFLSVQWHNKDAVVDRLHYVSRVFLEFSDWTWTIWGQSQVVWCLAACRVKNEKMWGVKTNIRVSRASVKKTELTDVRCTDLA